MGRVICFSNFFHIYKKKLRKHSFYLLNWCNWRPYLIQNWKQRPVKTEIEALKEELEKAKDYDDKLSKKETFIE